MTSRAGPAEVPEGPRAVIIFRVTLAVGIFVQAVAVAVAVALAAVIFAKARAVFAAAAGVRRKL